MSCFFRNQFFQLTCIIICLFIGACEPLVTQFEDVEDGILYKAKHTEPPPASVDTVKVMTWNIRFGAGRIPWFGDSCGDRVILTEDEVLTNLRGIADKINEVQPDILLLQEVDINSKKSAYINQLQWLLDHTYFNYGVLASTWKTQFVPSDGLGRIYEGNALLSRWKIIAAERIQLQLRGDQDALTRYFYVRPCILKAKVAVPGLDNFYAVDVHITASTADDTKKRQIDHLKAELDKITLSGGYFVAGGDLNTIPPGAATTDFCLDNACPGEIFHDPNHEPFHKEGHHFTHEKTWLVDLYDTYPSAVPLNEYLANELHYFTNTPKWDDFWQKKLDYLFTNYKWVPDSDSTHQETTALSDHVPISANWEVPR
jgi:endonuclease/exonuclease/phosphatase family metal-dependent hydrolase